MPYLVDGHNLVPHAGLSLDSVDDEAELISLLQEFRRQHRQGIEVYFDGAPVGRDGAQRFGQVIAHFVTVRSTADAAITARLRALGNAARNWTVVSSDSQVLSAAGAAGAMTLTSSEFAAMLRRDQTAAHKPPASSKRERPLSQDEVRQWLEIFKKR